MEEEKPAFDAPEAESKTKSDVNAPEEKDIKTPKNAQEKDAPKDDKPQGMKDAEDEDGKAKAPEETKDTPLEDKSDAEIIEQAAPEKKPQEKPDPNEKGSVKKGDANSIADQLAALAPIPDYKLAAPRKFSPVGGGHAKTTYLTILYGPDHAAHAHSAARARERGDRQGRGCLLHRRGGQSHPSGCAPAERRARS